MSQGVRSIHDIDAVLDGRLVHSVFQPIVDLTTGAVVGYEALARGPVGPLHAPDRLFSAARQADRLAELDQLCRSAAVRGAIASGIYAPLTLFVNIEPEILESAPLRELLLLAESAPGRLQLVLEITERALADRPAELMATVNGLRRAGWRIALDDVGANDLSLTFMSLLRPDIIKLDLQLVQRRPSPAVAEIMNAVNAYAERTGALILAEGIEEQQHIEVAEALGARLGQGWRFGRPGPINRLPTHIEGLSLPQPIESPSLNSPFGCLPWAVTPRRSRKPLLTQVSAHLEREAMRLGSTCMLLATFQIAEHFTPRVADRYHDLAEHLGFVAAIGHDLPRDESSRLRYANLADDDPVRNEWDLIVLAPHFACALVARDLGDNGPDDEREFEFALTYDRPTVEAAARALMSRIQRTRASSSP
ncbi:EAL domain, c-di-GMP-specific phosphodiesterase class I (or its enzymatically inactive variant) [Nakamurella panacisegetis]|uniref:EAL domain, c-di-GMP-specific phosphodiesterase class I (Or its enzymatically inactive variant) n=2 Tax=Nakamurella panacisegetis TaxID=1090615 RepID=A0A1H0T6Y2_9ACTN|nr:EAL domain, c-di-GMP-specific phosphodiesterase class I (or its enzymatically inactive variant) [Nakamurella panacisegetis]